MSKNNVTWSVRLDLDAAEIVEALVHELKSSRSQVCGDLIALVLQGPEVVGPSAKYLADAMANVGVDYQSNIASLSTERVGRVLSDRIKNLEAQIRAQHMHHLKEIPNDEDVSERVLGLVDRDKA